MLQLRTPELLFLLGCVLVLQLWSICSQVAALVLLSPALLAVLHLALLEEEPDLCNKQQAKPQRQVDSRPISGFLQGLTTRHSEDTETTAGRQDRLKLKHQDGVNISASQPNFKLSQHKTGSKKDIKIRGRSESVCSSILGAIPAARQTTRSSYLSRAQREVVHAWLRNIGQDDTPKMPKMEILTSVFRVAQPLTAKRLAEHHRTPDGGFRSCQAQFVTSVFSSSLDGGANGQVTPRRSWHSPQQRKNASTTSEEKCALACRRQAAEAPSFRYSPTYLISPYEGSPFSRANMQNNSVTRIAEGCCRQLVPISSSSFTRTSSSGYHSRLFDVQDRQPGGCLGSSSS